MTRADTMRAETMRADAMRADTMRAETMAVEVLATDATGLPFAVDFLVDLLEALLPIRDFFVTAIVDSPGNEIELLYDEILCMQRAKSDPMELISDKTLREL